MAGNRKAGSLWMLTRAQLFTSKLWLNTQNLVLLNAMFDLGQKVVCVDASYYPHVRGLYDSWIKHGKAYVIRDIRLGIEPDCRTGAVSVLLEGIVNPPSEGRSKIERGFNAERFRALEESDQTEPKTETETATMKAIKSETIDGHTIITTESKILCFSRQRRFITGRQLTANFWEWLELPGKKLIGDDLSFRLDAWKQHGI